MAESNISLECLDWTYRSTVNGSLYARNGTPSRTEENLKYFTYVFMSVQIVVGLTGNSISLLVWIKGKTCSNIASAFYFKLLAISDIFGLISSCWYSVISKIMGHILAYSSNTLTACIVYDFFNWYALQLSSWLVVCISVERVLSMFFPFSFHPRGAKTRAKVAFLVLIFALIGINSRVVVLEKSESGECCKASDGNDGFYWTMHKLSSFGMAVVAPFCLIVTCNTMLLVQLYLRKRTQIVDKQNSSQRVAMFTKFSIASGALLIVSLIPSLILYFHMWQTELGPDNLPYLYFSFNTRYLNNCLNFLVYCYSSTQFRSDLRACVNLNQNPPVKLVQPSPVTQRSSVARRIELSIRKHVDG